MAAPAHVSARVCRACRNPLPDDAAFCPECGAGVAVAPDGPHLPGLRILRHIGRGGDADVYVARQESLDRTVAVKVLRHGTDDPAAWRAFLHEARAIARLSGHPHVVTVYDTGRSETTGHPYLVTEFLDRGSLHDVIAQDGTLPPVRVAEIGAAIADALQAAHELGIHHRDVKPGNVLLAKDGRVKLADFGIARLLSGRSVTTTDSYAFTPEHVAPEVLRHEPDGPWSDLYGLASTLATALVGVAPMRQLPGERMDAYLARKMMAPAPRLPASVPRALAEPIERALDPSPDRRPSVREFGQAMAAAAVQLRQGPVGGEPARRTTPVALPWLGRNADANGAERSPLRRWLMVLAVCFGIWTLVVVAVVFLQSSGSDERGSETTGATTIPIVTSPGTTPASAVVVPTTLTTAPATTVTAATLPPATVPPATVATTVAAPTQPATTPPPAPAPAPAPDVISQDQAEQFLRTYYDEVNAGDYASSWASLTPEFQRGKARSYDYYTNFWNQNDIEIGAIQLVTADAKEATVHVALRWNGSGSWLTDEFVLRRAPTGELLIAEQTAVGR